MKRILLSVTIVLVLVSGALWLFGGNMRPEAPESPTFIELPVVQSTSTVRDVLLTDLVTAEPRGQFAEVLNVLHLDIYDVRTCSALGSDEQTLVITAQYTPNEAGLNTLDVAKAAVARWESFMLIDIGHLLYPERRRGTEAAPLAFATVPGTSMRNAQVTVDGAVVTVAYSWLLNYVLISTSLDCLESTMEDLYEHDI